MKLSKNKIYILVLLAGIMLVNGCGCKDKNKGGAASGNITELEEKQKEILKDLEPLYLEWKKEIFGGSWGSEPQDEATVKKKFKETYTDEHPVYGDYGDGVHRKESYVCAWKELKGAFETTGEKSGLVDARETVVTALHTMRRLINRAPPDKPKLKAYLEKELELDENRLKMLNIMIGLDVSDNVTIGNRPGASN